MSYAVCVGSPRPENFSYETTKSVNWLRDVYISGVYNNTQTLGASYSAYKVGTYYGVDNADYHLRMKRKEIIPHTPYLSIRMPTLALSGAQTAYQGSYTYVTREQPPVTGAPYLSLSNSLGFPFIFSPINHVDNFLTSIGIDPAAYIQLAASKAYSKGFDALTFTAELGQLVRLFKSAAERFIGLLSDLPNGIVSLLTTPVAQWMEARYGWRILSYDIEGINEAIKRLQGIEHTASRASAQFSQTYTRDHSSVYNFGSAVSTYSFIEDVVLGVRGNIFTDYVPPSFQFNPFVTAWEKITLSFVADWFFTVGAAINAVSLAVLSDNYASSYGISYDSVSNGVRSNAWKPGFGGTATQTCHQEFSVKRRVPLPIPYRPYNVIRLDEFKVLDILALILQRLTNIK
jgi:hypothetical protein